MSIIVTVNNYIGKAGTPYTVLIIVTNSVTSKISQAKILAIISSYTEYTIIFLQTSIPLQLLPRPLFEKKNILNS